MRNKLLLSTVALLAGVTLASAQQERGAPGGAQPGGAMERQAPQTQQRQEGQPQRGKETTGQRDQAPGQMQRQEGQRGKDQTTGQRDQAPGQMQREQGKDQQPQREKGTTGQREGKDQQPQREKGTTGQREPGQTQQRPEPKQGQAPQREPGQKDQQGAQGQQGGASFTAEQRTRIRQQVLVAGAPRVTNVDFSVSVGTVVPQHVRVVAVPDVIVDIHPQWRGFLYFVVEERIVIVDRNHRIVAILVV